MSKPIKESDNVMGVSVTTDGGTGLSIVTLCMNKKTLANLADAMITGATAILAINAPDDVLKKAAMLNDTGKRLLRDIVGG